MDTSLEKKRVVNWRRFINGHGTALGDVEENNNHGRTKQRISLEAEILTKICEKIRHLSHLGLAISYIDPNSNKSKPKAGFGLIHNS